MRHRMAHLELEVLQIPVFLPFALFRKIIIGLYRDVIPEVWRGDISVQVEMSPFHCCCSHPRQQQKNSNTAGKRSLLAKLIGAFRDVTSPASR